MERGKSGRPIQDEKMVESIRDGTEAGKKTRTQDQKSKMKEVVQELVNGRTHDEGFVKHTRKLGIESLVKAGTISIRKTVHGAKVYTG